MSKNAAAIAEFDRLWDFQLPIEQAAADRRALRQLNEARKQLKKAIRYRKTITPGVRLAQMNLKQRQAHRGRGNKPLQKSKQMQARMRALKALVVAAAANAAVAAYTWMTGESKW